MQIPVQIPVQGRFVLGVLHIPARRASGGPTMFLCPGLNGHRADVQRLATLTGRIAEKMGVTLFRFDYRGMGLSEGEFWESSVMTRLDDTKACIEFLEGCWQNDEHTLILSGFSDGARMAAAAGNMFHQYVRALSFWSPILLPTEVNVLGSSRLIREPRTRALVCPLYGVWLGTDYLRDLKLADSLDLFYQFDGPKWCIFGGEDEMCFPTYGVLEKNDTLENTEIFVVPGANHIYSRSDWAEQLINRTLDWAIRTAASSSGNA